MILVAIAGLSESPGEGLALAERNMEGKPFFALDARGGTKTNKIEVEETVGSEGGRMFRTRWIVDGHARWGLPADFEQDLYVAVLALLRRRGGPDERGGIEFTSYEILEVMGCKQKNDKAYERVLRGLKRIGHATITSEMAFYSRANGDLISESFNLWSHRYVERRGRRGGTARFHRLVFHAVFLSSLREGYVDDLDAAFYRSLSRPSAKRLFRLLGERCGERGLWRVPLLTLRDLLPLSPEYTARSTIERKLAPAHDELAEKRFLKDVSLESEGKTWHVVYRLSTGFGARREVDRVLSTPDGRYAFERLASFGIHKKVAAEAVRRHGQERCASFAEAQSAAISEGHVPASPAGYLIAAIREPGHDEYPRCKKTSPPGTRGRPEVPMSEAPADQNCKGGYDWLFKTGEEEPDPEGRAGARRSWRSLVMALLSDGEESGYPGVEDGWFDRFEGYRMVGDVLIVSSPDEASAGEVVERFGDEFTRLCKLRAGEHARVVIGTEEQCEDLHSRLLQGTGG